MPVKYSLALYIGMGGHAENTNGFENDSISSQISKGGSI